LAAICKELDVMEIVELAKIRSHGQPLVEIGDARQDDPIYDDIRAFNLNKTAPIAQLECRTARWDCVMKSWRASELIRELPNSRSLFRHKAAISVGNENAVIRRY